MTTRFCEPQSAVVTINLDGRESPPARVKTLGFTKTASTETPMPKPNLENPSPFVGPNVMLNTVASARTTFAVSVAEMLDTVNDTPSATLRGVNRLTVIVFNSLSSPPSVTTNDSAALVKLKVVKPKTGAATSRNTALYPVLGVAEVRVVSRHIVTVSFAVSNTVCTNAPAGTGSPA